MTNKNHKKLTGAELKKQVKKLDEKDSFFITINEQEYEVKHDVIFKKSKQIKVLEDIIQLFDESRESPELLEISTPYISLMIIKHFTDVFVSNNIDEALVTLDSLIDLEALHKIMNALPEEEITKIFNLLTESVENMNKNLEELEDESKKVYPKIKNKEVRDMFDDGTNE